MSLIGVINADSELDARIREALDTRWTGQYTVCSPAEPHRALELLDYDLPELVILNLSDPSGRTRTIMGNVRSDSWLHNFGIVGLYSRRTDDEQKLQKDYKDLNIVAMLEYGKVTSHLAKTVQIIEENRQLIFQWELAETLVDHVTGSVVIENDPLDVSVYAGVAATSLAARGLIDPDRKINLQIALTELILNAIEHGNCRIGYEEKSHWMQEGRSIADLVAEKCKDPAIRSRKVFFEWDIRSDRSKFVVRDQGEGFNVLAYRKKLQTASPDELHGRGIMLARSFVSKLAYNRKGNEVAITLEHTEQTSKKTPRGFTEEEHVTVQKNETVFQEGEPSNFLYYISSGQYSVYHNGSCVGTLNLTDIFMGEMSFLLNNQRSATVRADTDGMLVKIHREAFIAVVKEYPHYGIFLSKLIARKLVRSNIVSARMQAIRA